MKGITIRYCVFAILLTVALLGVLPLSALAQGKIGFTSMDTDSNVDIYVMNADGSNRTRLTNHISIDNEPAISPDGNKIAFVSNRDGNEEIYIMNADGSNLNRLTNNAAQERYPAFSADGSKIAFSSNRDDAYHEIYIMNADGTNQTRLTHNLLHDTEPTFSPDGRIAFVAERLLAQGGEPEIYVMNSDGTNQTRLTFTTPATGFGGALSPAFNRDGSKIVFRIFGDIYLMNSDGTNKTQLTSGPPFDSSPTFSPDGSRIAFGSSLEGTRPNIYVMNLDGSNRTAITNASWADYDPSWGGRANTAPTIAVFGQTVAGDSSGSFTIASVNDAEDVESSLSVTFNGGASATLNGVTVSGIAVNSVGNVTANVTATCGASNAAFTLRVTDSGGLIAEGTLNVSVTPETQAPTISLPSNIVTTLPLNSRDTSKIVEFTVSVTDNCDASPQVTVDPPSGWAFPVGTTTVNVTATDDSGNVATGNFTVTILYNFNGFFEPIENLPTVNSVTAGQGIPVKFSLSGSKGLSIFAADYPESHQIVCTSGSNISTVEETITAGGSSLSYDATTDQYIYIWKTQKAWKGTCRQLTVKLNDGSLRAANFQFR